MKDKTKFALVAIVLSLIILSLIGVCVAFLAKGFASRAVVGFTIAVTLTILFAVILKMVHSDIKTGMPSEDERGRKVRMYAAGYTYFISFCLWLGLMFVRDYLTREQIIGAGVFGMAVVFVILWWYLSRKGITT